MQKKPIDLIASWTEECYDYRIAFGKIMDLFELKTDIEKIIFSKVDWHDKVEYAHHYAYSTYHIRLLLKNKKSEYRSTNRNIYTLEYNGNYFKTLEQELEKLKLNNSTPKEVIKIVFDNDPGFIKFLEEKSIAFFDEKLTEVLNEQNKNKPQIQRQKNKI